LKSKYTLLAIVIFNYQVQQELAISSPCPS